MRLVPLSLPDAVPVGTSLPDGLMHLGVPLGIVLFIGGGALLVWSARRGWRD